MNVSRSVILPFSSAQMYAVIRDVEAYPQFLNWCDSVLLSTSDAHHQQAEMKVSYGKLKMAFSTRNTLVENQSIQMTLLTGPFRHLAGAWTLQELGDKACKVSLDMQFKFQNPITHQLFGKVFQKVVSAQVDAFQKRADELYAN